ncbi:hypothetical protein LJC56_09295 [Christensenellaceae bacterium OttesenSCG-928-K19]|nr:hypothetical protein [Christensenellaceae bacterium OttesenSCG-928-K19]
MKRLTIIAVVVVGILLGACAPTENIPAESSTPDATVLPAVTESVDPIPETSDMVVTPDTEQDIEVTKKNVEKLMPILDSIVRTIGIVGDMEYTPDDPEFFWTVLYLMSNNWGTTHPLVEPNGDDTTIGATHVPTSVMEEFAGAAFSSYPEYPAIPASLENSIWFDEEMGAYICESSDMGSTQTKLDDILVAQDGSVTAKVGLYDGAGTPEDLLGYVSFTLVKHPNAEGISNSIYLYSVTGATKIPK